MPRVSIITPCYNSERYIAQTIQSLQAQTLTDWEQIIVDDGSTDRSASVAESARVNEPRAKLIRKPNGGVASARNAGAAEISPGSQYLLFLDADDCLVPEFLAKMVDYLDSHPAASFVYCDPVFIDSNGVKMNTTPAEQGWLERWMPTALWARALPPDVAVTPFVSMYCLTTIIPSISLIRRAVYDQAGPWDEQLGHLYEDTDMFLRLALKGEVHHLPEALTLYRRHQNQSTANLERIAQQQLKLYRKWASATTLPESTRAMIKSAETFRVGRLGAVLALNDAKRLFKVKQYSFAIRKMIWSVKRYFIPQRFLRKG